MPAMACSAQVNTSSESAIEVGALARLERAQLARPVDGARVPDGERSHRFVACHALGGLPARIVALARAARHRRVKAVERIGVLHGKVGAARDVGARVQHRAPRIGSVEALGTQALARPAHVGGAVRGLHARDHAKAGEARDVGGSEDLRVLDPQAGRRTSRRPHLLEDVEHEGVGAIADGVHPHVKAAARRLAGEALHLLGRHEDQPRVPGIVTVRSVEGSPARAERSVEPELDGAHGESSVSHRLHRPALAIFPQAFLPLSAANTRKGSGRGR